MKHAKTADYGSLPNKGGNVLDVPHLPDEVRTSINHFLSNLNHCMFFSPHNEIIETHFRYAVNGVCLWNEKVFYGDGCGTARATAEQYALEVERMGGLAFYNKMYEDAWDAVHDAIMSSEEHLPIGQRYRTEALYAVETTAGKAARDAVYDAGKRSGELDEIKLYAAAEAAARDAALYALYLLATGVGFEGKDTSWEHVKRRWQLWELGYGVLCDYGDMLVIYGTRPIEAYGRMLRKG
ncbi:MAG: hypothetical protein M1160_03435 [Candidatus Marsarchaeota archaeon]|jgi:hypothetical protein|nr:hypothetical protein [Candidatus Marsarchaeota archaeon]MCL5111898.1 hypothetical protein [Candidatus Marsarchaeota archaeon]